MPDSSILVDFMLNRLNNLISDIVIYEENMKKNLDITNGLIYSQSILLKLVDKGIDREDAYSWVQKNAMNGGNFKQNIINDKQIGAFLSGDELEAAFDSQNYLKYVDYIFGNVFNKVQNA